MRRWSEVVLILGGLLLVGSSAAVQLDRDTHQRELARRLDARSGDSPRAARRGEPLGRLEIPRLRVSVMIAEGTDRRTLDRAVGHVRGTALPGMDGNVALAGHRDTFFKRFGSLRRGDQIRITNSDGVFAYRVVSTTIVEPQRADLLDPTIAPMLTLVTCYPFNAIGTAPKRFVVRAVAEVQAAAAPTDPVRARAARADRARSGAGSAS